jgi:2-phospho-L-lactate guanylyltransferase
MGNTWAIVLVKDFELAKERLAPALGREARRRLAQANAKLAIIAAAAADRVLAVCGSRDAARLAHAIGAELLLEAHPQGQNYAATLGIIHAASAGATAVLLLSSDLPLVTREAIAEMLRIAQQCLPPVVVAAPAIGRKGTNALYLAPPTAIGMHFGDDSLAKFKNDAICHNTVFLLHRSAALALDLDEPSDLDTLEYGRRSPDGQ